MLLPRWCNQPIRVVAASNSALLGHGEAGSQWGGWWRSVCGLGRKAGAALGTEDGNAQGLGWRPANGTSLGFSSSRGGMKADACGSVQVKGNVLERPGKGSESDLWCKSRIRNQPQLSLLSPQLTGWRRGRTSGGAATGWRAIWELATITSRSIPSGPATGY